MVAALLDALRAAHACALGGLATEPLSALALVDGLLTEGRLKLRKRLPHPHRHDGKGYITYARAADSLCW